MRCEGISGRIYELEEECIGHGGEGDIFCIVGQGTIVAKIFKENKRDGHREEKLKAMICKNLSKEQMKYITWPMDILYHQGEFVGYIMQKIENCQPLTMVYRDQNYNLMTRILTAINICIAIESIHEIGQVCGDLNPQNICVNLNENDRSNQFKVMFVDADSYHIIGNEKTYRCEVGMADYLAPEIQKKVTGGLSLATAPLPTYTKESDLFALAVHIFLLLMNGCHPFACAKDTQTKSFTAPQPMENIKDGFFPFVHKRGGIKIPVYAPEFNSLPKTIQELFILTFIDGYYNPKCRVKPREWIGELKKLIGVVVKCDKGHYYFNHNLECSMCCVQRKIMKEMREAGETPLPKPVEKAEDESSELIREVTTQAVFGMSSTPTERNEHFWDRIIIFVFLFILIIICFYMEMNK